jgi:hypothetical protein
MTVIRGFLLLQKVSIQDQMLTAADIKTKVFRSDLNVKGVAMGFAKMLAHIYETTYHHISENHLY